MDPVSLTASIIAFIQIADRVIDSCKSYLEAVRDAPADLRLILNETSILRMTLDNVRFLVSCGHTSPSLNSLGAQDGLIADCCKTIKELEGLFPSNSQALILGASSGHPSKRQKVKASVATLAWPLKENKAKKLLGQLAQYKVTINLVFTTEST